MGEAAQPNQLAGLSVAHGQFAEEVEAKTRN